MDSSNRSPWWMWAYPEYLNPVRSPVRFMKTFLGGGVLPDWQGRVTHLARKEFHHLLEESGFRITETRDFGPRFCPKWHLAVALKSD